MRADGLVHPDAPAIVAGADGASLQVPEGFDLFGAQFARDGDDLIVVAEGSPPLTVVEYFSVASPPNLVTANGPMLTGNVVEMLAGPRAPAQYAQADAPEGAVPIGEVETLTGTCTATRATGETVELGRDDPVFQGDVIQTSADSTLGIRLEDGTLASMSANSRLVLNEFVFEAGGSDNWMLVDLVEGAFAFLTGAIAPSGGMEITTPVAVMAVRGTLPIAFVMGQTGATEFFAGSDKDYELLHLTTREILAIVSSESGVVLTDPNAPIQSIELDPTTLDEINQLLDVLNDAAAEFGLLGIQEGSTFHTYSPFGDIDGNLAALIEFLLLLDGSLTEEAVIEVEDSDQFMMAEAELIANPDQDVTVEMAPVVIDVLANDSHPEGDALTIIFADVPNGQGTVSIVDGQQLEYDPGDAFTHLALGETTDVVITYAIADSTGAVTSTTVTVTVNGINQAPEIDPVAQTDLNEQTDTDPLQTTITVSFSDVDLNNVGHQAVVTGVVANGVTGGLSLDNAALMALVTPGTVTKNAGENSGSALLNFSVASNVFDYLAHGEVVTLTYTVAINDQDGGVTSQTFVMEITGTNDAPVIDVVLSDLEATVVEAGLDAGNNPVGSPNASGQIEASDVDNGGEFYSFTPPAGTYGTFAIDATGAWTYTLNDGAADHLALGETATDEFTVTVTDGFGATDEVLVTLTVVGSNDAPVVSDVALAAVEDGLAVVQSFDGDDIDSDDDAGSLVYTVATQPAEGTVANNGDGTFTFIPGSDFQDLAAGESRQVTFTYTATDSHGTVSDPATATVTVTGTNDEPLIVVGSTDDSGTVIELADGHQDENGIDHVAQGTIAFSDVDTSDTHSAGVVAGGPGYLGTFALGTIDQVSKTIGWTFTLADAAIDHLAENETLVQTYTVTVSDGNGGTVEQLVTVTITGTNDAPTIVAEATDANGSVTELPDQTGSNHEHVETGSIAFADVDLIDTHSASFTPGDSGYVGTFELGGVDAAGNTVGWTFTVTDSTIDNLPKNTTLIQTYIVTISDGQGGTVQQVVTISINGSNDAPVIVVDGDDVDSALLEEADETLTAEGTLTVSDVSVSDVVTAEVTAVVAAGDHNAEVAEATLLGFMQVTNPVLGSTDAVGTLTWNFDSNGEFFDFLADGETLVLTYTITVSDGTATDTHLVTITILGTNDQPVITAETLTASVAETLGAPDEGDTLGDSGLITFTDLDLSDGHSVTVTPQGTPLGTLVANLTGTATGGGTGEITWTYSVDAALVEHLAEGESLTETFAVTLSDGKGGSFTRTVVVTVDGSNDVPVITAGADLSGAILEGSGDLSETGAIAFTDVDQTDQLTVSADATTAVYTLADASTGALTPGQLAVLQAGFSLDQTSFANGGTVNWTYLVAESAIDFLGEGETVELSVTVTVTDLEGETAERVVTITITGANDGPMITVGADDTGSIVEGSGDLSETGAIAFTDVDQNDALTVSADATTTVYTLANATTGALTPGQLAVLQAGFSIDQTSFANSGTVNWTYALTESDIDFLAAGETVELRFTVTVTDSQGVTAEQVVTITVNGTDDAPVISVETGDSAAGDVFEITGRTGSSFQHVLDGSLTFTDVDVSDNGHGVTVAFAGASGASSGLTLTTAELNSLFSATVAQQTGANGTVGQIEWQFAASDAAFDYLDVGETLVLTYTVMVTHPNGNSSAQDVTITVHGAVEGPIFDFVVSEFKGGNSDFENVQVGTLGEEEVFLLLTPKGGSTINSSANDVGIGVGTRDISAGEGINIDLVTDAGSDENGPTYRAHLMAVAFSFTIAMVASGITATVFVRAVNADNDTNFDTDNDDGDVLADVSLIRVTDVNGNSYEIAQADFVIVDGYIVLDGLQDGDTLTVIGGEPFNRIEILNGAGETVPGTTDTYDGGSFVLTGMGADVEQIISGTAGNDYLVGTEGADYISGKEGDDVLIGLGGMDTLEGGPGNDLFVLTDLSIHDVIVDYGAGDVIDLTRLGFELAAGALNPAAADEFVRYNPTTGVLRVDVDGAAGPEPFVLAAELATPPPNVLVRLTDGDTTADVQIA